MKRTVTCCAVAALVLSGWAGCSSSDDGGASACNYAGTYRVTGSNHTGSCTAADAGATDTAVTVTITPVGDGSYAVQYEGVQGGCPGTTLPGCKLQGQCSITETDALEPNNATGTIQFSWTFAGSGFTGIDSVALPPAASLPNGCSSTSDATGVRM